MGFAAPGLTLDDSWGRLTPGERGHWRDSANRDWKTLQYAPTAARGNQRLMVEAAERDWRAFQFASSKLRGDVDVVRKVVSVGGRALQYASNEARSDRDI